jgi:hypothetical protein
MIPYRSGEVSDYERPLTDEELRTFASGFHDYRSRAFSLPFINLAQVVPLLQRFVHGLYRVDGDILARVRFLDTYAGIRVVSMIK